MKLSLCMIVKNEEKNIKDCLENIKDVVDEIIIVDTGSEDKTPWIAKEMGAKVYNFKWCNDFSAARNESIKHAKGEYIIYIDADDRISQKDAKKIYELKNHLPKDKNVAYAFKIIIPSPEGVFSSAYQIRLFPNISGVKFEFPIHEQIVPSLKRKGIKGMFTDIKIEHKGYIDLDTLKKKANRNLNILKKMLTEDPNNWFSHYFLAQTYEVLEEEQLAELHLKASLTEDCKRLDENWFIGASIKYSNLLKRKGNNKEAKDILLSLEEEFTENDIVKFFTAEIYMEERDYKEALNRYFSINPAKLSLVTIPMDEESIRYKYYLHLGECNEKLGYSKMALDAYKRAWKLANSDDLKKESIMKLIDLLIKMDKLDESVMYIEEYIKFEPSARLYNLLALGYIKMKEYEKAKNSLEKAISIDPSYISAKLRLAEVYMNIKEFNDAEKILSEILQNFYIAEIDRLTALLMLSYIHVCQFNIDSFLNDTDLVLKHLNLKASINSFQDLYLLYENISLQLKDDASGYWIEGIKKHLKIIIRHLYQEQNSNEFLNQ